MDTTLAITGGISTCDTDLSHYLSPFLVQQTSEKTKKDYWQEIQLFASFVRKPVQQVTPLDIIEYRRMLEAKNLKIATVYKRLSVLRSFFTFISQTWQIPNPALPVRLPKMVDESSRAVLSLQEAMRFLSVIDPSTPLGRRDRAICALLLICGLRTCEVSRANVEDMHEIEGFKVLRVHGKGNKDADCKLREDIFGAIQSHMEARGETKPGDPIFLATGNLGRGRLTAQAIQVRVKHYFRKAGINKAQLTVHSLRHSCATLCLTVGKADLLSVQRLLRHGNIQTTLRYLKSIDHLRDNAVDRNPISLPGF